MRVGAVPLAWPEVRGIEDVPVLKWERTAEEERWLSSTCTDLFSSSRMASEWASIPFPSPTAEAVIGQREEVEGWSFGKEAYVVGDGRKIKEEDSTLEIGFVTDESLTRMLCAREGR